ncbi:MAG: NYN domain-containing protein [Adlercreutzia equolifaciens]
MESKTTTESSDRRFALLIDADNVSARYLKPILNELSKYGTVTIKRIYGDWTLTLHAKWKDALLENSITPIQQFGYTQGKNATDSAMIIDAMDILYTDNVDGFCLVSSDSDFTRLASRLRESGRMVIGMGEKKTPTPFRRACDVFTTLELLVQNKRNEKGGGSNAVPKDSVEQAVVDIITDNQNNGKATGLGEIGSRLQKRYPDFDVRSYGTNLLSKLLEEFTRVRITKDHSSVTVELAEGEERPEKAEKPERAGKPEKAAKAAKVAKAEEAADVASELDGEAAATEASSAEAEKPEMEKSEMEKPEKPNRRSLQPSRYAPGCDEGRGAFVGGPPGRRGVARGRSGAVGCLHRSGGGGAGGRGRRSGREAAPETEPVAPEAQKDVRPGRRACAPSARPARRRKPMPPKRRRRARRKNRRRPRSPRRRKSRRGAARRPSRRRRRTRPPRRLPRRRRPPSEDCREEEHGQEGGPPEGAGSQEEARGRHPGRLHPRAGGRRWRRGHHALHHHRRPACQVQGLQGARPRLFPDAPVHGLGGRLRAGEERPQLPRAPFPIGRHALKYLIRPLPTPKRRCSCGSADPRSAPARRRLGVLAHRPDYPARLASAHPDRHRAPHCRCGRRRGWR